jgi:hypothetical protein
MISGHFTLLFMNLVHFLILRIQSHLLIDLI